MNIILIAPPAAGKGTQAEFISKKYNLSCISTGSLLRETIANGDPFQIQKKMRDGNLISDDIIISLVREKLIDLNRFVLDGFPRNINQARLLDEIFKEVNKKIDFVIYLSLEKSLGEQRIIGRRSCPKCKKVYNIYVNELRPSNENTCDDCKESLIVREDDNKETFENRYKIYKEQTEPLIDYYRSKGVLFEIDASQDKFEIFREIEDLLGEV